MSSLLSRRLVLASVAMLACWGCNKGGLNVPTGTVSGTVTVNGKPMSEGTITFFGENNGDTATSPIQKDGAYSLKYGTGFSVPAGDYRVAIVAGPPANAGPVDPASLMKTVKVGAPVKKQVPDKYKDPQTSSLVAVIKAGSNTGVNFDLK